mmetsp:Transcript_6732/g.14855  ORF Transcript_6732/g.14855 Transcript_6732/m.14855 type:complete len:211 (+) Transcript_6732:112-744(+)
MLSIRAPSSAAMHLCCLMLVSTAYYARAGVFRSSLVEQVQPAVVAEDAASKRDNAGADSHYYQARRELQTVTYPITFSTVSTFCDFWAQHMSDVSYVNTAPTWIDSLSSYAKSGGIATARISCIKTTALAGYSGYLQLAASRPGSTTLSSIRTYYFPNTTTPVCPSSATALPTFAEMACYSAANAGALHPRLSAAYSCRSKFAGTTWGTC